MVDVDFAQKASIGQYLPGKTPLHRLNPGVKLLLVTLLLASFLITSPFWGNLAALGMILLWGKLGKVPGSFLFGNVRPMLPFLFFISLMQLFFTGVGDAETVLRLGRFTITWGGVWEGLGVFLRFAAILGLLTLFTAITPSREIGHGTENLLCPLSRIGFPAHEISLIVTITFRFIPILAGEAEDLMKAQLSRGADLGGSRNPVKRVVSYLPLAVPLFISALERAEQLAEAMESRGYRSGAERSRYVRYGLTRGDVLATLLGLLSSLTLVLLGYVRGEAAISRFILSIIN